MMTKRDPSPTQNTGHAPLAHTSGHVLGPDLSGVCVLQIVPELDTGGVEQTVLDVAEAVVKAGGRALVASKGGRLSDKLQALGAIFVPMPVHSKNPWVQWQNYFALKDLIKTQNVNIVHVRSRAPALSALRAAKAMKIVSVSTYHGIYNAKSSLKRAYNALMTKADFVIANSLYTRDHILKTYPKVNRARLVPIARGIDMRRFDPAKISEAQIEAIALSFGVPRHSPAKRFLLAARLTRWKGQEVIIEAARRLREQGIEAFEILMAGDHQGRQDYLEGLKSKITDYGLENHIRLVGHCQDMPAAFSLCDFALAPSIEPEAFGRTAVEPQALLRPPLASAHGATEETVINGVTGWLIEPGNPEAWAKAMAEALKLSPEAYSAMAQAGRAEATAQFSLEHMCLKTLELYKTALQKP